MKYAAPRGTHDIWGEKAEQIQKLEKTAREVFLRYNFSEIRVPTFEDAELFTRSIGEATDIVEKEMYVFRDRKDRKLALRPEGTAGVVRAYLENNLSVNLPLAKLFYMGSMFRYERPQAGRYREFFQIGAECFGNASPLADVEMILLATAVLKEFGLKDVKVHIHSLGCPNCRPAYRNSLQSFFAGKEDICADCKKRVEKNPLRLLDCKIDSAKFDAAPKMEEFLCQECKADFKIVNELLTACGCDYTVDSRLVRGLDYYTKTVFEIRSAAVGSQDALAAGGRYDNLVSELGGPKTPAVGFALGQERVAMAAQNTNALKNESKNVVFIAYSSEILSKDAFIMLSKLRNEVPKNGNITFETSFSGKNLKSQLKLADKLGAGRVVIFGDEEIKRQAITLKDMKTGQQTEVLINALPEHIL